MHAGAVLQGVLVRTEKNQTSTMDGGSLSGSITVGDSYAGTFHQTGGTIDASMVYLNGGTGGETLFHLENGSLNASGIAVGSYDPFTPGPVRFYQTGGSVTAMGPNALQIASPSDGVPTYELAAGSLQARAISVAATGMTGSRGLLKITDSAAVVEVSDFVTLGASAEVNAVPGAAIHLTRWVNNSVHPEYLGDLRHLALVFEGNPAVAKPFELAGLDLGPSISGFTGNFAQGTVEFGGDDGAGWVQLVDSFNNSTANANPEVLYVKRLILNAGSTLDLNGKTVYYYRFTDNGGTLMTNGGQLIQVPVLPGDSSGDNLVNTLDIAPFVQALVNPTAYELAYPHADLLAMNDLDGNGLVNAFDIAFFVDALAHAPTSSAVPEPASALCLALACLCSRRHSR